MRFICHLNKTKQWCRIAHVHLTIQIQSSRRTVSNVQSVVEGFIYFIFHKQQVGEQMAASE